MTTKWTTTQEALLCQVMGVRKGTIIDDNQTVVIMDRTGTVYESAAAFASIITQQTLEAVYAEGIKVVDERNGDENLNVVETDYHEYEIPIVAPEDCLMIALGVRLTQEVQNAWARGDTISDKLCDIFFRFTCGTHKSDAIALPQYMVVSFRCYSEYNPDAGDGDYDVTPLGVVWASPQTIRLPFKGYPDDVPSLGVAVSPFV